MMNKKRASSIKKIIPILVIASMVFVTMSTMVRSAAPTVTYSSISNGATFVDVMPGDGVNLTVRVADTDSNLQSVNIYTNASGTWANIHSSGALGGVASYNTTKFKVSVWTGSLVKYWFNVTANDGTDTQYVYSFTTEYVFGNMQNTIYNDIKTYYGSSIYKNATGEYYMAFFNSTNAQILMKTSTNGVDWFNRTTTTVDATVAGGWSEPDGWFTYNNKPSFFYVDAVAASVAPLMMASKGTTWTTVSAGLNGWNNAAYSIGTAITYYDSKWILLSGRSAAANPYLDLYYGTPPATWTSIATIASGGQSVSYYWCPSLNIFDSYLILTYKDVNNYFHWRTYDGSTLVDKSYVSTAVITSLSVIKDPVANQLVAVYTKTGDLFYRVLTSPTGTWSNEYTIATTPATFDYVNAHYIDDRLVLSVANNARSTLYYANYMISAPDYSGRTSGFNTSYNRIIFPDAAPTDTNVFSNTYTLKNMDKRAIKTIKWYASNIGDILSASNMKFWTNMSGSWVGYPVSANRNTSVIDISDVSGSEWTPGETLWWRIEILSMGGVAESLHTTDEDIYYIVTM